MSSTPIVIDGRLVAQRIKNELRQKIELAQLKVGLATVLVGDDPASASYVRSKHKTCEELGIRSFRVALGAHATQSEVETAIDTLVANPEVHGILVQLPLPSHLDSERILSKVPPHKDVDGFHPVNLGLLANRQAAIGTVPCTPAGCLELLKDANTKISGSNALVLGRSAIVGMPMALLLSRADATVTIAHSKTQNLPQLLGQADIVVAAVGKPNWVSGALLKPGCTVIDVGINRTAQGLCGDVDYASALPVVRAITPVPGGVGPMTIAMLMSNTLQLALAQKAK